MTLWTAQEAAAATGGQAIGDWSVNGVSIDTRTLQTGDLFVALKAARDGHDFVVQALAKGAGAALVTHRPEGVAEDAPLLIVDDVLPALEDLGRAARARTGAKVVAVTGSVGKTSTKEMLRDVLSAQGKTHVAEASYNNHWGVPLTLARMPEDTEFAVIEIGMNHPGEIAPLAQMARPHVAMITTVAAAHLEAFENIDGIAHEKAAIFDGLEPDGVAVTNGDLDTAPILEAKACEKAAQTLLFGEAARNSYRIKDLKLIDTVTVAEGQAGDLAVLYKVMAAGRHFAVNGMGVLAVVDALGLDVALAATDLARWLPPAGRGAREQVVLDPVMREQVVELIDDAFNANPTSMVAALEVLAAAKPTDGLGRINKGRRIAVLGDMLELGPDEMTLHAAIADLPFLDQLDLIHCVGPRMNLLWAALPDGLRGDWVEEADAMAENAHRLIDAGDVVLIKGSKGSKVSKVVDAIRKLGHAAPHSE
ncbi:UDP-N-acetylmuramoyl-tripeptide--D-alanyl-D-alanine ligase [Thalassovita mediterranea]|uniref:UDP-N-acetylmuramoyl-tripeptide--D-alanyl-D-alanine ligase n=1 Tax=Thalassovita mediterranea TaxID=340021 RepID=A0A0P1GSV0_9RHOB|nr:UDP-N-acetylmuramoyl-tripeptide--D-alanyl-D-alanine ligase [Thalassovita mediterranea]CUH85710.1 UDP-N-acetylmuramoyl-tripeptide--D-alanyl-D-alanine ligase [Thalassovita mediterranea]SIS29874.1 UDP-N-acetylmuramoyl-tripeptide--D-alanyl-D-alanine ligase [Thalassovita mediterranea]